MAEDNVTPENHSDPSQRLVELCKKAWLPDNDESRKVNAEIDELLDLDDIDVNVTDADGRTALHYASQLARVYLIDQLLDLGADPNSQERKRGFAPLHFVALSGTLKWALELLLSAGADVNAEAHFGVTPLHIASVIGPVDILTCLLENGADANRREGIFKFTPLLVATYHGSVEIVDLLVNRGGADPNVGTDEDLTPLQLASMLGDVAVAKLLIKAGANVNRRHRTTGLTALHLSATSGNHEAVKDLLEIGHCLTNLGSSSVITETMTYCSISADGRNAVTDLLLKNGADLQARDARGKTALHLATRHRSGSVVEILLRAGADVDARDDDDRVPLHEAVEQKTNSEGLGLLLAFGADLTDVFEQCESRLRRSTELLYDCAMFQLLEHFTKMVAAKLLIANVFKRCIHEHGLQIYYGECAKEVERMRNYKLGNGVTLYGLLHVEPMRRLSYIKNVPVNLESKFPKYCGIIRASFLEASRRKPLVQPAMTAWNRLTGISWPDKCVGCLLGFFDNGMLKMIVKAAAIVPVVKEEASQELTSTSELVQV